MGEGWEHPIRRRRCYSDLGKTAKRNEGDIGGPQDCDGTKMFSKTVCGGEQMAEGQAYISEAVIHQPQRLL